MQKCAVSCGRYARAAACRTRMRMLSAQTNSEKHKRMLPSTARSPGPGTRRRRRRCHRRHRRCGPHSMPKFGHDVLTHAGRPFSARAGGLEHGRAACWRQRRLCGCEPTQLGSETARRPLPARRGRRPQPMARPTPKFRPCAAASRC